MSVKAREIITYAYREVHASRTKEPSSAELEDGLRYMNRLMAKLESQGIDVGYTTLNGLDEDLTSHPFAVMGILKNLALSLWPQYRSEPANGLIVFSANRSLSTLRAIALQGFDVALYPSTMSVGSGNRERPYDDKFYTNEPYTGEYIAKEEASIRRNQ